MTASDCTPDEGQRSIDCDEYQRFTSDRLQSAEQGVSDAFSELVWMVEHGKEIDRGEFVHVLDQLKDAEQEVRALSRVTLGPEEERKLP